MLHRSNAEGSLWKEGGSQGEAAGQSRNPVRGRAGAGTWPEAVFEGGRRRPGGREDLPGSLRPACYLNGAAVVAAVAVKAGTAGAPKTKGSREAPLALGSLAGNGQSARRRHGAA